MNDFWFNILIELGLLVLLGVLYYFYQKKKILQYEADKGPLVMGYVLQCCLTDRGEVLFHTSFVRRPQVFIELAHFVEVGVEDAALATQVPSLGRLAPFRLFKH